jgi:hypothetical protein
MNVRTKMAAAAVTAALAAGGGAALALSGNAAAAPAIGARTEALVETLSAAAKPGLQSHGPSFDAIVAAVASRLHVSTAKVGPALQTLFSAVPDNTPLSPAFAAAAHSIGVSTQQLQAALLYAKQSLAPVGQAKQNLPAGTRAKSGAPRGAYTGGPAPRVVHNEFVAAVARELNVSAARISTALQPLFAAGQAGVSSPSFAAAAQSLGVSTQQLQDAITQAKQSLAPHS